MRIATKTQTMPLLLCVIVITGQSLAHDGAIGVVKERMDGMSSLGDHAKRVSRMLRGKTSFDLDAIDEAAHAFVEHGGKIPAFFPDTANSRESAVTEALPAIWDNWDEFEAIATNFVRDSQDLQSVVNDVSGRSINGKAQMSSVRSAFLKAAKNCSACHEQFRLDSDAPHQH